MLLPSIDFINSVTFRTGRPGPRLLILGSVHGIETCGPAAINKILASIYSAEFRIASGQVTFVPFSNPSAYLEGRRFSSRDINRDFREYKEAKIYADFYTNSLIEIMNQNDVLIDIHSFRASGRPFVFVGPENNGGRLERFASAQAEQELAESLGIPTLVDGWLRAYSKFALEQNRLIQKGKIIVDDHNIAVSSFGRGTTEYFRSRKGKIALTVECGQHDNLETIDFAYRTIINALNFFGMISIKTPYSFEQKDMFSRNRGESFRFAKIFIKHDNDDKILVPFNAFCEVVKHQPIGVRKSGEPVLAPSNGVIIFFYPDAKPGKEWMYFAERTERFWS